MRVCPGANVFTLKPTGSALFPPPATPASSSPQGEQEVEQMAVWGEGEWGDQDHTVECSGRITLECGCGERLVLIGLEEDWRSEQHTDFECACGKGLILSNRLREEVFDFGRLMRGTFRIPGG